MSCVNDFSPLILAAAAAIPALIGSLGTWMALKKDLSHVKGRQYATLDDTHKLLYIVENGFHGPVVQRGSAPAPAVEPPAAGPPAA